MLQQGSSRVFNDPITWPGGWAAGSLAAAVVAVCGRALKTGGAPWAEVAPRSQGASEQRSLKKSSRSGVTEPEGDCKEGIFGAKVEGAVAAHGVWVVSTLSKYHKPRNDFPEGQA